MITNAFMFWNRKVLSEFLTINLNMDSISSGRSAVLTGRERSGGGKHLLHGLLERHGSSIGGRRIEDRRSNEEHQRDLR